MGNLDRRSLSAVAANLGAQFTKPEQDMAQSIMSQQQGLAMGLYNGPASQSGKFIDPYAGDEPARMKAQVKWLDAVSGDEKASVGWAAGRAAAQAAYDTASKAEGAIPENLDSQNPLAKLIRSAMQSVSASGDRSMTTGSIRTADDLRRQSWFQASEPQLDAALAATQQIYQGASSSA